MFTTNDELLAHFDFANHLEYILLAKFKSSYIGFSVQRNYPDNLSYKPPRKADGTPDSYALIQVIYNKDGKAVNAERVPILIRVFHYSKFLGEHSFYHFGSPDCPTRESVEMSQRTPRPLDLDFEDIYYFDHTANTFRDKENNSISGISILNTVFDEICATVGTRRRTRFDAKLKMQRFLIACCEKSSDGIEYVMKKVFGRTFKVDSIIRKYFEGYSEKDIEIEEKDRIKIFDYEASKPIIVLFCFLVMGAYTYFYYFPATSRYFKIIAENNLLSLCFVITVVCILDTVVPKLLFRLMRGFFVLKNRLEKPLQFK